MSNQSAEKICRFCNKTDGELESVSPYWAAKIIKFWTHKECKKEGMEKEAYECQKIDSDCNDCYFFKRGEMVNKGVFKGTCLKFNKETFAHPNFCSSHDCFVHRKDKL